MGIRARFTKRSLLLSGLLIAAGFTCGCGSSTPAGDSGAPAPVTGTTAAAASAPAASTQSPPSSVGAARLVAREEVVPGQLWVSVYVNTFETQDGPLPAWTFVSDGLWAARQREILFSVKREPGEAEGAYDRGLFKLYAAIHSLAREGKLVGVNAYTQTSPASVPFLGREDFHCVMYMRPQVPAGVEVRAPSLSAVFVTCRELELAQKLGFTRVQSRLGLSVRYYPTPPWTDRRRAEVAGAGEVEQSVLAKTTRADLSGVAVRLERKGGVAGDTRKGGFFAPGDRVVLRVLPRGAKTLKDTMAQKEADHGVMFLLESDPGADACLVWSPGQAAPSAISTPNATGERLCGNYLLLAPTGEEPGASTYEDGFSVLLSEAVWKRVREAIAAGAPISIPASGAVPTFAVEWVPAVYTNPVDGSRVETEDGWNEYSPKEQGASAAGSAAAAEVVLLTSEAEIAQRVTVAELSRWMKAIIGVVETEVDAQKRASRSDLVIECEVRPGKEKAFHLAQRPAGDRALADAIRPKLAATDAPAVNGPVRFQLKFKIHGGSGAGDWVPVPEP